MPVSIWASLEHFCQAGKETKAFSGVEITLIGPAMCSQMGPSSTGHLQRSDLFVHSKCANSEHVWIEKFIYYTSFSTRSWVISVCALEICDKGLNRW